MDIIRSAAMNHFDFISATNVVFLNIWHPCAVSYENRIDWTLPRLSEQIERRTGRRMSRSRPSVVLRKKEALPASAPDTR
jgi:hypothetical protein